MLFYPLEVAERATVAWGHPDEAAYRRLLAALTPDNLLVSLMAKGLSTDRKERIYGTAYSYREGRRGAGSRLRWRHERVGPGQRERSDFFWVRQRRIRGSGASPATRATAAVVANFFGTPFYSELRTRQQLGYIVGSSASASQRQRYFAFVVQSSAYGPDELRRRAEAFIATLPGSLAAIDQAAWSTLVAGVRANLEQKPKNMQERAEQYFSDAYAYDGDWERRQATLQALDALTLPQAVAFLTTAVDPASARRRTVQVQSSSHASGQALKLRSPIGLPGRPRASSADRPVPGSALAGDCRCRGRRPVQAGLRDSIRQPLLT